MHLWKHSISLRYSRLPSITNRKVVHRSQKSWLMGKLVTSEITLLILPNWFRTLMLKIDDKITTKKRMKILGMNEESKENKIGEVEKKRGKMPDWFSMNWWLAIRVLILVLLSPVVLAFIALSVGKDIKMMIGRLCYWMIGKTRNSDSAPQVS